MKLDVIGARLYAVPEFLCGQSSDGVVREDGMALGVAILTGEVEQRPQEPHCLIRPGRAYL
jgi:hypothetical protein